MRRAASAVIVLAALVAAGFAGVNATRPAQAQEPVEVTFVFSDVFDPDTSGRTGLVGGTGDGILGVQCSGSNPQGGTPQIPAQVLTQLTFDTVNIRVFNHLGQPVSSLVRLNCTVDALVEQTPTSLLQKALKERKLTVRR
jgi:hypothetical protein